MHRPSNFFALAVLAIVFLVSAAAVPVQLKTDRDSGSALRAVLVAKTYIAEGGENGVIHMEGVGVGASGGNQGQAEAREPEPDNGTIHVNIGGIGGSGRDKGQSEARDNGVLHMQGISGSGGSQPEVRENGVIHMQGISGSGVVGLGAPSDFALRHNEDDSDSAAEPEIRDNGVLHMILDGDEEPAPEIRDNGTLHMDTEEPSTTEIRDNGVLHMGIGDLPSLVLPHSTRTYGF
ncbi:hypothetical protein C8F01DRAFT_360194 [Mycena amicta]|nr:hypothetical protein C8F01DRAFT_360194 [Mycena amicta]